MAHKMTKRGNLDNEITYEHFCDTKADMADIDPNDINLGSACIVLADESAGGALNFYLAKSDKTWVQA